MRVVVELSAGKRQRSERAGGIFKAGRMIDAGRFQELLWMGSGSEMKDMIQ